MPVIAGRSGTPSGSASYNGGTNYWEDFLAAASGTVTKGYLYVVSGLDRNAKMFIKHGAACYVSNPQSVSGITNQWVEFTFASGPTVAQSDPISLGYISDYGIVIGQDSGGGYVGYKADSYASPGCADSDPSYFWNKNTGWYLFGEESGPQGSTCWGHTTGVSQSNARAFAGNWVGTGAVEGSGDGERVVIAPGKHLESEIVAVSGTVEIALNRYAAGDAADVMYRTGASSAACRAASWQPYTGPFTSSGYVQVRVGG